MYEFEIEFKMNMNYVFDMNVYMDYELNEF